MKINKILLIIFIFIISFSLYSQSKTQEDKFSTLNIIINRVTYTELGFIVEYYAGGKFRELYLPNKFFFSGLAVKVVEDDPHISPQMNVIYKNFEPMKVKLYMPTYPMGITYPAIELLSNEIIQKFKNTTKLEILLKD